jgi:hypothetical protein
MATYKTVWSKIRFGGGWATDFGPMFHGAPAGDGTIVIPFLNPADNIVYEANGGIRKMPGTSKLNSSQLGSGASVMGLFDYWRQGTSGTPVQKRILHVSTVVMADNADGTFANIGTGFVSGAVPQYSTFDDLAIIANDASADVPKSWDQTTFQSLAGSPPNFSFSIPHKNRQWAAGVIAAPSRLYYSVNLDPEDWSGATSGSIDIDPSDGDMITGLASFRNELWVFKGPYKGSIHRITGSSASDFARTTFIRGLGAAWQNSIFPLPNDLGFISPRGTVHSLVSTDRFGDYDQSSLSFPINQTLRTNLSHNYHRKWWAATDFDSGYTLIAFTPSGQTTNTRLLMADFRFMAMGEPTPRWAQWTTYGAACVTPVIDTGNRLRLFAGGNDGYVYKLDQADRSHNSGAISMNASTPFMTYGSEETIKTLCAVGIELAPKSDQNVSVKWLCDGQSEQTLTVAQGGSAVLGPWSTNQFTLDSSTLGGGRYQPRYIETEEGGEFRAIRYTIAEAVTASDCEVHGIATKIAVGTDSTENA